MTDYTLTHLNMKIDGINAHLGKFGSKLALVNEYDSRGRVNNISIIYAISIGDTIPIKLGLNHAEASLYINGMDQGIHIMTHIQEMQNERDNS